jgi:hypothetical protein
MTTLTKEQSMLHRRLATICIMIDQATNKGVSDRLVDEAHEICRQLGIPTASRDLVGKPFIPGVTELQP